MRRRPRRPSRLVLEDGNPARGPIAASPAIGHNSRAAEPPLLPSWASCARCQHWNPPSDQETRDYDLFRLGLARRRVREPRGACDRVMLRWNGPSAFSATVGRSRCFNFTERERPQRRPVIRAVSFDEVGQAIGRLVEIARSDTGHSARTADFLLAWWNGSDHGHFPILHLCNSDAIVSEDMLIIMAYLAQEPVVYADAWGYKEEMADLYRLWREEP